MNIKKLARAVARESKRCRIEGGGESISIWPDGSYTLQVCRRNGTARNTPEGIEDRLMVIDWPIDAATLAQMIRAKLEARNG